MTEIPIAGCLSDYRKLVMASRGITPSNFQETYNWMSRFVVWKGVTAISELFGFGAIWDGDLSTLNLKVGYVYSARCSISVT